MLLFGILWYFQIFCIGTIWYFVVLSDFCIITMWYFVVLIFCQFLVFYVTFRFLVGNGTIWYFMVLSGFGTGTFWYFMILFGIITLWGLSVVMETRILIRSGPKPYAAFPPPQ